MTASTSNICALSEAIRNHKQENTLSRRQLFARRFSGISLIILLALPYWIIRQYARIAPSQAKKLQLRMHDFGARLLYNNIVKWGGFLIKIGQYLAARPDLAPEAYLRALAPLRDQVPARPIHAFYPTLDQGFPKGLEEYFSFFSDKAIAAASFGQVHRAQDKNGNEYAVKIQYPNLDDIVRIDLQSVRFALWLLQRWFPGWNLSTMYDEIKTTAAQELDYRYEALAAQRLKSSLAESSIKVPRVYESLSSRRILVTEWVHGRSLNQTTIDSLNQNQRDNISSRLLDCFLRQLLDERFFHADPHAGNILITEADSESPEIWLIDYGMMGTISDEEALLYARFLWHVMQDDTDGMVDIVCRLSNMSREYDTKENRKELQQLAKKVYAAAQDGTSIGRQGAERQLALAQEINRFMRGMRGVQLPGHTILLSRALGLLEGICIDLAPDRTLLDIVSPILTKRVGSHEQISWFYNQGKALIKNYIELPNQVSTLSVQIRQLQESRSGNPYTLFATLLLFIALFTSEGFVKWLCIAFALIFISIELFSRVFQRR